MLSKGFRKSRRGVWLACLVFLGPAVLAEKTEDASVSQLTIEGDSAVFLQEQNTIEYVGNVVAFMEGMRIVGDRVLVEMNADRIERITTNGAPATFWQQRDTTERDTTAAANTIISLLSVAEKVKVLPDPVIYLNCTVYAPDVEFLKK